MAKTTANVVAALASFVGAVGGPDISVREGDLFAADDPIVRKFPKLFAPVAVRRTAPAVRIEQATAAPGEKRGA